MHIYTAKKKSVNASMKLQMQAIEWVTANGREGESIFISECGSDN